MPELERYMLHLTAELDAKLRHAVDDFDFNSYIAAARRLRNNDLSRLLFRYPQGRASIARSIAATGVQTDKRRAYRTVLDTLFHALVRWLAPVLVFTSRGSVGHALSRRRVGAFAGMAGGSRVPSGRRPTGPQLRELRAQVTEAIEPLRRDKVLGFEPRSRSDVPELPRHRQRSSPSCSSSRQSQTGDVLTVVKTDNHKCGRCWRYLPEVEEDGALCGRCEEVLNG